MIWNGAQVHLVTNHLPVVGMGIAFVVLAFGMITRNSTVRRTGVGLVVLSALFTLPAYFSGEEAEEVIEHLPGISEALIHSHEESAEFAFVWMALTGFVSAVTMVLGRVKREHLETKAQWITFALTLASIGILANAAHLGGLIRHPEIRPDAAVVPESAQNSGSSEAEHED